MHQKSLFFVTIGILSRSFSYEQYICNGCHYLMQKTINFVDVAIVFVKESYYRIHFWYMNKLLCN